MYSKDDLLEIKILSEKELYHDGALLPGTPLNDHNYEVVHLEAIGEECLIYKGIDLSNGNFVTLKEFFPKEAFGFDEIIYFERNFDSLNLEIKNPSTKVIKDATDLMNRFVEERKYKEKMAINPPLTKVINDFRDYGTVYLVTTYNIWPSLETVLNSSYKLDFGTINTWVSDLIKQVVPFHKRGIIHRNLNPENIFVRENGISIDGLGTCKEFSNIKVINVNAYEGRYYAPEINLSKGEIGTWSDVYAIGKILIDMLVKSSDEGEYFSALEQLPNEEIKDKYSRGIKQAISFKIEDRLQDIMALGKILLPDQKEVKNYTPPKQVVAMIAALAVISSSLVLWRTGPAPEPPQASIDTIIIEDELTPMGAIKEVFFYDTTEVVLSLEDAIIWHRLIDTRMISFEILIDDQSFLTKALLPTQRSLNLKELGLKVGNYSLILTYEYEKHVYDIHLAFQLKQ